MDDRIELVIYKSNRYGITVILNNIRISGPGCVGTEIIKHMFKVRRSDIEMALKNDTSYAKEPPQNKNNPQKQQQDKVAIPRNCLTCSVQGSMTQECCRKCADFSNWHGTTTAANKQSKLCPTCGGNGMSVVWNFCPECGNKLTL